jgi:hypothetical protein
MVGFVGGIALIVVAGVLGQVVGRSPRTGCSTCPSAAPA